MSEQHAFPGQPDIMSGPGGRIAAAQPGLTKRELFAAMVMQGWMATYGPELEFPKAAFHSVIAENCVAMADALLATLKEPSP